MATILESGIPDASPKRSVREHKFGGDVTRADAVLDAVAPWTVAEVHDPDRPVQWTRTTYLDTDELAYYRSGATRGASRRLRIREYASAPDLVEPPLLTGDCLLELKESLGNTRSKVRLHASPEIITTLVDSSGHEMPGTARGDSRAVEMLRSWLRRDRPRPRATTWYRRVARTGDAGNVRISVDRALFFARPESVGRAGMPAEPCGIVARAAEQVVEVKLTADAPTWLRKAMATLPESAGFSKFRVAMNAVLSQPLH